MLFNAAIIKNVHAQQSIKNNQYSITYFRGSADTGLYNQKIKALANNDKTGRWPAKAPYPLPGALLPFNRIVSFYGNLFSPFMGILGELPGQAMLQKLLEEKNNWQLADPKTPVMPALHYIAVTAQGSPGKDGMYRYRMPHAQIDTIISWSKQINAITFLDIQTGHSPVAVEVAALKEYLLLPNVHLGIDPEYSMKNGGVPCTRIGTFDASDINDVIDYLQKIVQDNRLPPKILIVHRFTQPMVTNYKMIKKVPEVQVVMNMDGFGAKWLKLDSYKAYIFRQPVQFAGFKLFYKYDREHGKPDLFTPKEILQLTPIPVYIQYQ